MTTTSSAEWRARLIDSTEEVRALLRRSHRIAHARRLDLIRAHVGMHRDVSLVVLLDVGDGEAEQVLVKALAHDAPEVSKAVLHQPHAV